MKEGESSGQNGRFDVRRFIVPQRQGIKLTDDPLLLFLFFYVNTVSLASGFGLV